MSHRRPPAPKLRPASRGVHLHGLEPCHAEAPRGVRPASVSAFRLPLSAFFPPTPNPQPPIPARHALTLIEMLVALAVTLVMMAAVVNLFANISGSIRNRRAVIEVNSQLRQVRQRLALDLAGATAKAQPAHGPNQIWSEPGNNSGYIEIVEGRWSDSNPSLLLDGKIDTTATPKNLELDYTTSLVPSGGDPQIKIPQSSIRVPAGGDVTNGGALGDWDDVLALTVRSEAEPFKAQVGGNLVESTLAEVVWFAGENSPGDPPPNNEPGMRRIYRRVLLIAPTLGPWAYSTGGDEGRPQNVSVHFVPGSAPNLGQWVANTLSDLTKRENRAFRDYDPTVPAASVYPHLFSGARLISDNEYLVLSDALAFDVRLYDPGAPLYEASSAAVVQPGDPGWVANAGSAFTPVGFGAYCDLGWNWDLSASPRVPYFTGIWLPAGSPTPLFEIPRRAGCHPYVLPAAATSLTGFPAVYDTWSFHYENDGIGQDLLLQNNYTPPPAPPTPPPPPQFAPWQLNTLDQGANGLDDDGANGVDDIGERETFPPYNFPLRGVKVSLRIYERDARQIREVSVTHSFAE